jgi:hypothetical protein
VSPCEFNEPEIPILSPDEAIAVPAFAARALASYFLQVGFLAGHQAAERRPDSVVFLREKVQRRKMNLVLLALLAIPAGRRRRNNPADS